MLISRLGFVFFSLCMWLRLENIFFCVFLCIEYVLNRMMFVFFGVLVFLRFLVVLSMFIILFELYLFIW